MLRRRKVLTRSQYEKRRRRHQFVASVCDASPPRRPTDQGLVQQTLLESNGFQKADEALEIYNGNHRSHKRGRPRGINQMQSPMNESLCSSSKSSYTDSDVASQNLSEDVFSNEETAPSMQSFESVGDVMSPIGIRKIRERPFTVEMAKVSVNISRHANDQVVPRANFHDEKSKVSNGVGAKLSEFLWCCGNSLFFTSKQTTSKIIQGPGISLVEERKLRRSTRKGNFRKSRLPVSSSNGSDSKQIDQIEVIPVDEHFQSAGSVSYAEMDNTGMVFAPNAVIDLEKSKPSIPPLPWWKREKWSFSSLSGGVDSYDVSHGRTSAYTKKVSNRHSSNTQQKEEELGDSNFCVKHEEKAHLDSPHSPIRCKQMDDESLHFKDSGVVRPFQVFNPKIEEPKKLKKYIRMDDVSDGSLSVPETLSNGRLLGKAPVMVETVSPENGSVIESETDLSELIRRRDASHGDNPMIVHLHTDPDSSFEDNNDAVFHVLAASTVAIEDSVKEGTVKSHTYERVVPNAIERSMTKGQNAQIDDESQPKRNVSPPKRTQKPQIQTENSVIYPSAPEPLFAERDGDGSQHIRNFRENSRYPSEKGRQNEFIDLTSHDEACLSRRKRSKSPIRLYGDPPFPYRMDGSPVRGRRFLSRSEVAADMDEEIFDKELLSQLEAIESLHDIVLSKNDSRDMTRALSPDKSAFLDGSRIVMLKPIVNVYKIETTDQQGLEASKRLRQNKSPARNRSRKLDLQIRTVFSDRENDFSTCKDDPVAECCASPVVTVSFEDDERSVDEELRKLAASEKLLRKELEEIQKRSAKRRWEIQTEENTENDKSLHRPSFANGRPGVTDVGSPKTGAKNTLRVIDVSCIDLGFDQNQSLVSSLPIASAYRETSKNENEVFFSRAPCFLSPKSDIPVSDPFMASKIQNTGSPHVDKPSNSLRKTSAKFESARPRSKLSDSSFCMENSSHEWMQSNQRETLYVPSLQNQTPVLSPESDEKKYDSIFSGISQDEINFGSVQLQDRGDTEKVNHDDLIDRDGSWGAIEDLYVLEAHSALESPRQRGTVSGERDITILREQASKEFPISMFSSRLANALQPEPLPLVQVANPPNVQGIKSKDEGNLSIGEVALLDTCNAQQSLYASLLHLSPRNVSSREKLHDISRTVRGPDSSPRLQSLLHRHRHLMMNGNDAATSAILGEQTNAAKEVVLGRGIYGELVRRSRHSNLSSFSHDNSVSLELTTSGLPDNCIDLTNTPGGNRLAGHSSSSKRLERQRKLHMEMQARRRAEHENHLSMRLSPARRRAIKSLRRNHVKSLFKDYTSSTATKNMIKLTPTVQQPGVNRCSNSDALVHLYMPVTGDSEREYLKKKKGSDHNSRDLLSIASSTRSKDLVQSLPSNAKTRNATAGKPGSLLWEATAGREH